MRNVLNTRKDLRTVNSIAEITQTMKGYVLSSWSAIKHYLPMWFISMFKFGLKGGAGLLINIGLLTVFVEFVGIPEEWAIFFAWGITLVPGYLATDMWVFNIFSSPEDVIGHSRRGAIFYGILWSGKGLNYVIYIVLIELGILYQAAWFIGAVTVFPFTFGANYIIWKFEPSSIEDIWLILKHQVI